MILGKGLESLGDVLSMQAPHTRDNSLSLSLALSHVNSLPSAFLSFRCCRFAFCDQQGGKGLESLGDTLRMQAPPMRDNSLSLSRSRSLALSRANSLPSAFLGSRCCRLAFYDQQGGKGLESLGDVLSMQAPPMRDNSLSLSLARSLSPV